MKNNEALKVNKVMMVDENNNETLKKVEIRKSDAAGEVTLYNIYPECDNNHRVVAYVGGQRHEFVDCKDTDQLIEELRSLFQRGRVKAGDELLSTPNVIAKKISALEAKAIVRFERNAWVNQSSIPAALRETRPNMINKVMDFGDYILEVTPRGPKKMSYAYLTFSKKTDMWLQKVARQ